MWECLPYPKPSPQRVLESGERAFKVAFLMALEPRRSRTSSYQLMLMDQDGSNLVKIFPSGEGQGLAPHDFYWLPQYAIEDSPFYLAVIYQGDFGWWMRLLAKPSS